MGERSVKIRRSGVRKAARKQRSWSVLKKERAGFGKAVRKQQNGPVWKETRELLSGSALRKAA